MIRRRTVGINSLRTRPLRRRRRVGRPKVRRRRPPSPTPSHAVRSEGDKACRPSPIKGLLFTRASFTNSTSLTQLLRRFLQAQELVRSSTKLTAKHEAVDEHPLSAVSTAAKRVFRTPRQRIEYTRRLTSGIPSSIGRIQCSRLSEQGTLKTPLL